MKKLITSILSIFLLTSAAYSFDRPGFSIGGSYTAAYFETSAHEVEGNEKSAEESGAALGGYASVFAELTLADRLTIGVSYVPEDLETESVETKWAKSKGVSGAKSKAVSGMVLGKERKTSGGKETRRKNNVRNWSDFLEVSGMR